MSDIYSSLSAHSRTFPKISHNPASTSSKDHRYYTLDTRRDVQSRCVIKDAVDVGGGGEGGGFSSSQLILVLFTETIPHRKEFPAALLVHLPHIGFLTKWRESQYIVNSQTSIFFSGSVSGCVWSVKGTFSRYFNNSSFINLSSSSDRLNTAHLSTVPRNKSTK